MDIRSPEATRPWQHVLEPLSGYLTLGASLDKNISLHGEAYNFGPPGHQNHSVRDLIHEMAKHWDHVRWKDVSKKEEFFHEAGLLKLNCDKALKDLNWLPTLQFEETINKTVQWYKAFYENSEGSMVDFSLSQIEQYTQLASSRRLSWASD